VSEITQAPSKTHTVEEFWDYVHLPENAGRRLELVNGEIVEQDDSAQLTSVIAGRIGYFLNQHVIPRDLGYVTGPTAYYALSNKDFFSPDVAFISKKRHPTLKGDFFPVAPDIAIEIIKDKTKAEALQRKMQAYAASGVQTWEVYPRLRSVNIMYYPLRSGKSFGEENLLDCGNVLPGFEVKVSEIFPK